MLNLVDLWFYYFSINLKMFFKFFFKTGNLFLIADTTFYKFESCQGISCRKCEFPHFLCPGIPSNRDMINLVKGNTCFFKTKFNSLIGESCPVLYSPETFFFNCCYHYSIYKYGCGTICMITIQA